MRYVGAVCCVALSTAVAHDDALKSFAGKGRGAGKSRSDGQCAADYHNCYGHRRCCSPNSRCYTKTAGVRFAQCRPNGCLGTCGWECRLLLPIQSSEATAEYGDGAQNVSDAIAALKTFEPDPRRPPTGKSERLGNLIDSWYFASLGAGSPTAHLISACATRTLQTRLPR